MALGMLSAASKIMIAQAERDILIFNLLKKLAEVHCFMTQDDCLDEIESMRGIVEKIVQQTHECAHFIRDYSETKNFPQRHFGRRCATISGPSWSRRDHFCAGNTLDLGDLAYAKGAESNTMQQCLPGTRTEILV
ncbi:uncharacterized protein F5891DRAFT_143107 [Suillus fuscotomentosus]|uniref:Uncharacterized protein n=1 Tax=Suillus fuscotomentosus TaxID=1912939 RepID=A0AAD4EAH5_9AGAM|nr:uncharacterized protein F5891DRAFT_143107 [Suillus fuscotomentosus]KAG1902572.1 hypothetical protein F5891DRAFT_143107 [Suillus fuscotomentosus]